MSILLFVVTLAVIGFLLWVVVTYVPMPEPYKRAVIAIVILVTVIWAITVMVGSSSFITAPRL